MLAGVINADEKTRKLLRPVQRADDQCEEIKGKKNDVTMRAA